MSPLDLNILAELVDAHYLGGHASFPWKEVGDFPEIPEDTFELFARHGWRLEIDQEGDCCASWSYLGETNSDVPELIDFNLKMRQRIVEKALKAFRALDDVVGTGSVVIDPGYVGLCLISHADFLNSQVSWLKFTPIEDYSYLLVERRAPLTIFAIELECDYPLLEALKFSLGRSC